MAPPGIKVIAHEKPAKRASWATHGIDGWYIGPTYEHYRCYRIYATKTRAERICDTVEFFPHNFRMPEQSSADAAIRAAQELIHALKHPEPATPFQKLSNEHLDALEKLADIFAGRNIPFQLFCYHNNDNLKSSIFIVTTLHQTFFYFSTRP
jgi:hypothetical protein